MNTKVLLTQGFSEMSGAMLDEMPLEDCLKPIVPKPRENPEDRVARLIAESYERDLTRAEKSILNKAEWAAKPRAVHVIAEKKAEARQPIGTFLGNKQRMQAFKEKLLSEDNGNKVINKVLRIAMDDKHPGQVSALKMCVDRMLPMSAFEDAKNQGRTAIAISITGIGESTKTILNNETGDVIDV